MRIHKIQLDNFASYDKAILDIDKLGNVINVFGSTGAGKTTLLVDSISFCLFARAYGEESPSSERLVIRPNRNKSRAELEFSIGEKRYRIIREIELGLGSRISSKVMLMENIGGEWKNKATGATAIKDFIDKNLKIDYDTFLKTIAIRQGDVTSILEAEPRERRELFLKMLNLEFKKEREKAREMRDYFKDEKTKTETKIELLEQKLKEEAEIDKDLKEVEKQLISLISFKKKKQEEKEALEREKEEKEKEYNDLNNKIEIYKQKLIDYNNKLVRRKELKNEIDQVISKLKNEEDLKIKYDEILKKLEKLDQFRILYNDIKNKEKELEYINEKLISIQKELRELEEIKKKIEEIEIKKQDFQRNSKKQDEILKLIEEMNKSISKLESELGQIIRLKEALESSNIAERRCPICGSYISEEKFDEIYHHFMSEENRINNELEEKKKKKDELEKELEMIKSSVIKLQKEIAPEEFYRNRILELEKKILEKGELDEKLNSISNEIRELKSRDLYLEFTGIKDLEDFRKKLVNERDKIDRDLKEIEKEKGRIENLKRNIEEIEGEIKELEKLLLEKPNEEYLKNLAIEIDEIKKRLKSLDEMLNKISQELGKIEGKQNELKSRKEEIENAKIELEKLRKALNEYEEKFEIYSVLYDDIFNEKGFPLRFLDSYLEDLNKIINTEYLSPILRNKRVEIKRVEDNIEIRVFDDIYSRDLATYSGGEKTAIGFAIRLAIAKTLAFRRGVSPKFLIIDEGFGPLSVEIRELLLRSILNLKQEYEKIFIVSHLEDIQENPVFDSVIKIYKDENNISHIEILR